MFIAALVLLVTLAVFQVFYVVLYRRAIGKNPNPVDPNKQSNWSPEVVLIVCVRGNDPTLASCFESLRSQNYPDYRILVVADHVNDPGLQFVCSLPEQPPIETMVFTPQPRGSLKVQALVHAVDSVLSTCEIVAFVDADAKVSRSWISKMVAPLENETIGATTGNRWFSLPARSTENWLGTYIRHIWNAAAVVQMCLYNIPWGGSLAIRTETIRNAKILEGWQGKFCEDTILKRLLEPSNQAVVRVPDLVNDNQESISLANFLAWSTRQLLTVRLYHRAWSLVIGHGILVALALVVPILACIIQVAKGNTLYALIICVTFLFVQLLNALLIKQIAKTNRSLLTKPSTSPSENWLLFMMATLVAQFVQPLAVLKSLLAKKVSWRGIDYRISSPEKIELLEFVPYREDKPGKDRMNSID